MKTVSALLAVSLLLPLMTGCVTETERQPGDLPEIPEPDQDQAARFNLQLGRSYLVQGRLEMAEEKLRKALEQNDRLPGAHTALGIVLERTDREQEAEKSYRRALSVDPSYTEARYLYGRLLCRQERFEQGERELGRLLEGDERDGLETVYLQIGRCRLADGDPAGAEVAVRQVLARNPVYPEALLEMARIRVSDEQPMQALEYLRKFHLQRPRNAESLWVAFQAETALGNWDKALDYAGALRTEFPESEQAAKVRRMLVP